MEVLLQIKMNEKVFVKNPEKSDLGKKIISQSIKYIHKNGFETLTFKKLAQEIGTTEASIYRYFENKHKLLIYLTNWYWGWLEFQLNYHTNNINDPVTKLKIVIKLLATSVIDDAKTSYVDQSQLHKIVITEGSKTYLTKHVGEDNKDHLFEPYKDLCAFIGNIILECDKDYKYPHSLASSIVEVAHYQNFFMNHLPSLTDFGVDKDEQKITDFIEELIFSSLASSTK